MTGNDAILYVRQILRDIESPTKQGQFWHDNEILLCLNIAQNCYVHASLSANLHSLLTSLIVQTTPFQATNISGLPIPYLHFVSGNILGTPNRLVSVYTGEESIPYKNVSHDALIIHGDTLTFYRNGQPISGTVFGVMYYYRYPNPIIDNAVNMADFTRDVYRGAICRHAATLLGTKETVNQRELKDKQQTRLYNSLVPADLVHKFGDIDLNLFRKETK